jgi:hypothetical protein
MALALVVEPRSLRTGDDVSRRHSVMVSMIRFLTEDCRSPNGHNSETVSHVLMRRVRLSMCNPG